MPRKSNSFTIVYKSIFQLCNNRVEFALTQNIIFDVYRNDFVHLGDDDVGIEQGAQTLLQVFLTISEGTQIYKIDTNCLGKSIIYRS